MKPSPEVQDFIKAWEGCFLNKYICPAGVPTIGYGHAFKPHEPQADVISKEEAEAYFQRDLDEIAQAVDDMVDVDVAQHEYDALVSFAFNLGPDRLKGSTLLRKVNARRYDDAAHEFERWVYAGQKKLPGLVKRRKAECAMWDRGDYSGRP